jgi:hypothetical protein
MCMMHKFLGIMIDAFQIKKVELLNSVHPETASFGPRRRSRSFSILKIACYACG